ncbi:GNAT family N-acetyltransferase [Streptomyces albidoflavus]|uniref:GNAT family N-acetyltransferase n=1 Tax=Streptomyces albidoflavus TaxID=1886 RepID=UPI00344CF7E3|nr:GNAT family N-acetyltransferase [Streptomyces albidoflavus]WTD43299.1 GNAT family N-acetyltransferase [Streptomyces albidoflavus]WTD82429.1 GNAT family N-acetyltransferase [Streptomyces albidoflavus]
MPWSEEDFPLLVAGNSEEMTAHLGGPESAEALAARHRRYLALDEGGDADGRMFRITAAPPGTAHRPAGAIGFWLSEWQGRQVWESGWHVLPALHGHGIATSAARLVAARAQAAGGPRTLHAFPSPTHAASNGVCRKAGFTLAGEARVEYPKGTWVACNDWRIDLDADG